MLRHPLLLALVTLLVPALRGLSNPAPEAPAGVRPEIPAELEPWRAWATWDDLDTDCPRPYQDGKKPLCFWPSRLGLEVARSGGRFDLGLTVFAEAWVPLPGNAEVWPVSVMDGATLLAVVEHGNHPAVHLPAGAHRLQGSFAWSEIPQRIQVPQEIGLLSLSIEGQAVNAPSWDAEGFIWLKRGASAEEADKDFLSVKLYAALEDGIPLWLRTEVELTVSGKSREEEIGTTLPEGWKLASVESPLPVALDETGRLKAQVRAGKWTLHADAFRFDNPKELRYPAAGKRAVTEELLAFRAQPDFRTMEIAGVPSIDVSQTVFPRQWHELPVYRWDLANPLRLEERLRGMGEQKVGGLSIHRELWLDEDGRGLTFRDNLTGQRQETWRLDAAPGQDLGSVRSGGTGQLITRNPLTEAPGVEIRTRTVNLEATGRMDRTKGFSATGWQADAERLKATLNLPPGWRLFALFGADWVSGDWLTAWTLLDLFLLLLFALSIYRLFGLLAAVLAFVAFGLAYQEPGAPCYTWLALLAFVALARVVPPGKAHRLVIIGKWICLLVLALILIPFLARQTQQAIFPQLERVSSASGSRLYESMDELQYHDLNEAVPSAPANEHESPALRPSPVFKSSAGGLLLLGRRRGDAADDNLSQDAKAHIQTGPGVPEWTWRTVNFGWNGPVRSVQQIHPILISLGLERLLTVLRVTLLLALAAVLLRTRRSGATIPPAAAAKVVVAWMLLAGTASAQSPIPDKQTLDTLRERLLKPSDAYPTAADLPLVSLTLKDRHLTIEAEVHAAIRTAVPLPGRLPAWSPQTVLLDDQPETVLRREDGYLWLVVPAGVHHARVEGMLPVATEWEWTFQLKPRRVKIEAPGWTVTGVQADGVPEAQVFFALQQKATAGAASYERQDLQSLVTIDRNLELGLVWQVHNTITRLSPAGKALAVRVPLLPGENVLSNTVVKDGFVEARLGAQEASFSWESGLAVTNHLALATRASDTWVERWHLVVSPIWNVALAGLPPIFQAENAALVPVWQPWPGEKVELAVTRPEAIAGATVTVSKAVHEMALGQRQRVSKLDLTLRCSLGQDFPIELPAAAEVTSLVHQGKATPVRKDGMRVIVPLQPGEQMLSLAWKTDNALGVQVQGEEVRLPVESANVETVITVPDNEWVLWAYGPLRGPAVRFWGILACSLLAAAALARAPFSPLRAVSWMLLALGLTQVPVEAALVVVGWLFFLSWRGSDRFGRLGNISYNSLQLLLILVTVPAIVILVYAVSEGLLGRPEMFILGNGSSRSVLRWFQPRSAELLPQPGIVGISIWWYRFLMLLWALWLAASLLRWLHLGWRNFERGGLFRRRPARVTPPPLRKAEAPIPGPVAGSESSPG